MKPAARLLALLLLAATQATAQTWPAKPIRVVIPYAAGGAGDITFRSVAPAMEARLGQRFVVDNKAGASGNIGAADVARAAPDGHTLLLGATNNFVTNQFLYRNIGFDPVDAFAPITMISNAPTVVTVHPGLPAKTLADLVALARAQPGKLNFGSPGTGTAAHLAAEWFSQLAGVQMVHVPFKGSPPAVQALMANEIQVYFTPLSVISGQVAAGKAVAIAVAAPARLEALPAVPTTAESKMPALITGNWWGLVAPKGTDAKITERLAAEVKQALADPALRKRYAELGLIPGGMPPQEFAASLRSEAVRWKKIIEDAKVTAE